MLKNYCKKIVLLWLAPVLLAACATNQNCIEGDCLNGKGTFLLPDARRYIGEFKNGRFDGNGSYIWLDGRKYTGEFKNNAFHGNGTLEFPDGKTYTGQFENNRFNGTGIYTFPNGNRYEGAFGEDAFHGRGEFTFADGKKYSGGFVNNRFEGFGEYRFSDGSVYRGLFKNNLFDGEGEYTFPGGKTINGFFKEGRWQSPDNEIVLESTEGPLSAPDELQTAAERQQAELEAIEAYEATLSDEELERQVGLIPSQQASANLRIYKELLRRYPENKKYQKKVAHYQSVVDKKTAQ